MYQFSKDPRVMTLIFYFRIYYFIVLTFSAMKTSPDFETLPPFYKTYVTQVENQELMEALKTSGTVTAGLVLSIPESLGEYRYAPEKWSIKELLCHMIDAERIFAYRALRFARNDDTPLTGFDENSYAPQANAHARTLQQIVTEMKNVRAATLDLFNSFTAEMLMRKGSANHNIISVVNIGYVIAGHETHHRNVLTERYLKK
jgi:uncharacterized damage-inducible protein DinB